MRYFIKIYFYDTNTDFEKVELFPISKEIAFSKSKCFDFCLDLEYDSESYFILAYSTLCVYSLLSESFTTIIDKEYIYMFG